MIRTIKPFNNTRTFINTQKRFKSYESFRNDWLNNSLDKSNIACIVNKNNYENNDDILKNFLINGGTTFREHVGNTIYYDEKILISNFGQVIFIVEPIFANAKNVFLNKNHNWFNNLLIKRNIFPSVKTIFVNSSLRFPFSNTIDDFDEIYVTPFYYTEAKYKHSHIKGITLEDYYQLIIDNEIVEPKTEKIS